LDLVMMLFVEVMETHRPPDERRSGVTAEDQRNRFLNMEVREANRILPVCVPKFEIRGHVSNLWSKGIQFLLLVLVCFSIFDI